MKRKLNMRKHVAMLIAIILVVSLVACGEDQSASTSLGSNASTQQEAVVTQPEPTTTEPTEAVTEPAVEEPVEEVVEEPVVEEPVVEETVMDNESLLAQLNESSTPVYVTTSKWNIDSIRILIKDSNQHTFIAVLSDGDSFDVPSESDEICVSSFYLPKKLKELYVDGELWSVTILQQEYNGELYDRLFEMPLTTTTEVKHVNEHDFTFVYEDGTTESIVVYLTGGKDL